MSILGIFKRRGIPLSDLMHDFHDMHSHLLPGVDDGSNSLKQSLRLITSIEQLGFKAIYCTPHVIADTYPNNTNQYLRERFEKFAGALPESCGLDIRLGAEYLLDEILLSRVADNPLIMGDKHLLIEFTMHGTTSNIFETIFEIQAMGYTPIIAHPERYSFIADNNDSTMKHLLDVGCKMQLNLLSVSGWHGNAAQKMSYKMLNENVYDFVGCDIHSNSHIEAINGMTMPAKYADKIERLKQNNKSLF